jgi:hypothetical protein
MKNAIIVLFVISIAALAILNPAKRQHCLYADDENHWRPCEIHPSNATLPALSNKPFEVPQPPLVPRPPNVRVAD